MATPNSFAYFFFLLGSALVYRLLPKGAKRYYLLGVSLIFYFLCCREGFWLLCLSMGANYGLGRWMEKAARKKAILVPGLVLQLGMLAVFKYLKLFGVTLNLLMPLGISFYVFVSCGYLMDLYSGRPAERDPVSYCLFVSFFPAILSGPIERTKTLLPQLHDLHNAGLEDYKEGLLRLVTGLFKKVLLADTLAILVDTAYASPEAFSGLQLMVAAIAYSLQIYFDFSAYSDMAVGAARLFGIRLTENFRAPYSAKSVKEFWRRWHIYLSGWFRDYLYFPLGGSRKGKWRTYLNIMIVFALSGLWHGAAWTFVLWGLLCGAYQVMEALLPLPERLCRKKWFGAVQILCTFALTTIAWVFFRSGSLSQALLILKRILTAAGACFPLQIGAMGLYGLRFWLVALCSGGVLLAEGLELRERILHTTWLRYGLLVAMLLAVAVFGAYGEGYNPQEFVYFKF